MTCPLCSVPMIRGVKLDCKTGDAQKFICPRCKAHHWQQITDNVGIHFRKIRETHQRPLEVNA